MCNTLVRSCSELFVVTPVKWHQVRGTSAIGCDYVGRGDLNLFRASSPRSDACKETGVCEVVL